MSHAQNRAIVILKLSSFIVLFVVSFILFVLIVFGLYKTYKVEHSKNQAAFRGGKLPEPLPDGFYKGNLFKGLGANWQGKVFDQAQHTGINQFSDGQRFVFKTYQAQGLRDRNTTVLRIDYNQKGNPWWLHFVVDEIVEVEPGHYLGKVHLKIIPGLPFTVSYFELSK